MATKYLTDNTLVIHPDTAVPTSLTAGQRLPSWAGDLVGDHLLSDTKPGSEDDEGDEADDSSADLPDDAPPMRGRGSGIEAWKTYADERGIDYDKDTTDRAVVIEAVKAHA